jgi:RHS repeat-associated protein
MDVVIDRGSDGSAFDYLNGFGIDVKLRQSGGGWGSLYFLQDSLGSTIALTNTSGGGVESEQRYEAFGGGGASARTSYLYTGREYDSLINLYYYRARWYDQSQGRFITEDPILSHENSNLYAYVNNNPIMFVDPEGLQGWPNPGNASADRGMRMYEDIGRRRVNGHNRFPGEGNSFMRHCTVSCEIGMHWSVGEARAFGVGNEFQGFIWHDLFRLPSRISGETPWAFQLDDFAANEKGFSCVSMVRSGQCGSCEECCDKKREEKNQKDCEEEKKRHDRFKPKGPNDPRLFYRKGV